MEASDTIKNAVSNIRYYAGKIGEAAKNQFNLDYDNGEVKGINTGPGSIRYDCLAAIMTTSALLDVYCDNIESNLKSAESQDKLLFSEVSNGI